MSTPAPAPAARPGVYTFAVNPDHGTTIGRAWVDQLVDLGAQRVSIELRADAANHFPLPLYQRTISLFAERGIAVRGVLSLGFNRPWREGNATRLLYPNQPLDYAPRQNRWIKDTCVRAGRVCGVLAREGLSQVAVANEPNLKALLPVGANVPPEDSDKAPALNPVVFACYAYELAGWLHYAGIPHVELGALSFIAGPLTIANARNPYGAAYLRAGLSGLVATGAHVMEPHAGGKKWPRWESISLNSEGYWTPRLAAAAISAIDLVTRDFGWEAPPIVIGEWGVRADQYQAAKALETQAALEACAIQLYFFQHPCRSPNQIGDYALIDWTEDGVEIRPGGGRSHWYPQIATQVRAAHGTPA